MRTVLLGIGCGLALAAAASAQPVGGEADYQAYCAACHGEGGAVPRPGAPDLTRLSAANGGAFPYWRVFAIIDGRLLLPGHGTRDMPVWGQTFLPEAQAREGARGGEVATLERIHALAEYVATLQRP